MIEHYREKLQAAIARVSPQKAGTGRTSMTSEPPVVVYTQKDNTGDDLAEGTQHLKEALDARNAAEWRAGFREQVNAARTSHFCASSYGAAFLVSATCSSRSWIC
jgi:hypothetical protein